MEIREPAVMLQFHYPASVYIPCSLGVSVSQSASQSQLQLNRVLIYRRISLRWAAFIWTGAKNEPTRYELYDTLEIATV